MALAGGQVDDAPGRDQIQPPPPCELVLLDQRLDLVCTGRTLFGAASPKGQELEDQYFGAIKDRISKFMRDLDI